MQYTGTSKGILAEMIPRRKKERDSFYEARKKITERQCSDTIRDRQSVLGGGGVVVYSGPKLNKQLGSS